MAHLVHKHVEGTGAKAVDTSMKEVAGSGGIFFEKDTERVIGIETFELREPKRGKAGSETGWTEA